MRPSIIQPDTPSLLTLTFTLLLATVPLGTAKPFSKPGTNGIPDTATDWWIWRYNERFWHNQKVKHDSPDNIQRPVYKPNTANTVSWCDFRAMWRREKTMVEIGAKNEKAEHCHTIEHAAGVKGESPCRNLGMDNSPMMGMWPSKDLQCKLYFDDWCREWTLEDGGDKKGKDRARIWFDSALLVTEANTWGLDNLDASKGTWKQEGQGFRRRGFEGYGPKSIRCWFPGRAYGLSTDNANTGVEMSAGMKRSEEEVEGGEVFGIDGREEVVGSVGETEGGEEMMRRSVVEGDGHGKVYEVEVEAEDNYADAVLESPTDD